MTVTITKRPLLPVVQIKKNDGSTYTFNSLASPQVFDFRMKKCTVKPPYDRTGGTFEFVIRSSDGSNSAMNTLLGNIQNGNLVTIWIGKTDAGKSKEFLGVIQTIQIDEPTKTLMEVTISGPDWGSDILKHRIVSGAWIQHKLSDGITIDTSDNSTLISQIASDLIQDNNRYPLTTDGITAAAQGIVYSSANVTPPTLQIVQFQANFEKLDDKLSELDDIGGTIHYVDADKNFIMSLALNSTPSNLLLVDDYNDSVAAGWDQTKVALIEPKPSYKKTVENNLRRLFGLGGDSIAIDQKQETTSGTPTQVDTLWLAQKFTPTKQNLNSIGVYVGQVGSPNVTANLVCMLIEDNGGEPTGSILRQATKGPGETIAAGGWIYYPLQATLNIKADYWIVLVRCGDSTHTYKWYNDGSAGGAHATSSDGITWTNVTSSYNFAFREYYSTPLLSVYPLDAVATDRHFWEEVYHRPDIIQADTLTKFLLAIANRLLAQKEVFTATIYSGDTLIRNSQSLRVRKQASGYKFDDIYTTTAVEYNFQDTDDLATGSMTFDASFTLYSNFTR